MRAKQGAGAGAHAASDLLPPIDVRVTQVNRGRLRLLQALVPMAALLAALARGFDSLLALALLAILAGICGWLFISRTRARAGRPARYLGRFGSIESKFDLANLGNGVGTDDAPSFSS